MEGQGVWLHSASVLGGGRGLCGALIALLLGKEHQYTLNRGVDGPQSHWMLWRRKQSLELPRNSTIIVGGRAHGLFTVPAELSQLCVNHIALK